jgi:hypothetical protein
VALTQGTHAELTLTRQKVLLAKPALEAVDWDRIRRHLHNPTISLPICTQDVMGSAHGSDSVTTCGGTDRQSQ